MPYERWWQAIVESRFDGRDGLFVHPVQDERVMAGNGTIGLELAEELPDVDAVLVPWGGGGLFTGIASALAGAAPRRRRSTRSSRRPAPPLAAALAAGEPREVDVHARRSSTAPAPRACCRAMWERARPLLAGAFVVSLDETAAAVRLLAERARVVAEGAGALALAAALAGRGAGRADRLHRLGREHRRRPARRRSWAARRPTS